MRLRATPLLLLAALLLMASKCEYLSQPYFDRFDARAATGNLPDVGYVEAYRAPSYISNGSLQQLDDRFGSSIESADPLLISFFQEGGATYAIPRDFQTLALLVNVELLGEAGWGRPPDRWEDLFAASNDLASIGRFGIGISPSFWNFLPFVYQAGGSFVDEDGTQVTLESGEAFEALEFYLALANEGGGLVVEESIESPLEGFPYRPTRLLVEAFVAGDVAMLVVPNVTYQFLSEQELGFEMMVAELPAGPAGRATLPYVTGFGIHNPEALDRDEVIAFLEFLVGPSGQEVWLDSPIYMPADPSLREEWLERHPAAAAFMKGADYMANYQPEASSFDVIAEFDAQATEIMARALAGEIDSAAALAELSGAAQRMLES
jgi:multiple sugar transport system substrate-binding protein